MNLHPLLRLAVIVVLLGAALAYPLYLRQTRKVPAAKVTPISLKVPLATNAVAASTNATNMTNATNIVAGPKTNAPGPLGTNATAVVSTNAPGGTNAVAGAIAGGPNAPGVLPPGRGAGPSGTADAGKPGGSDEIDLSFQGANVDMVAQWLAKTTGKSVVKHPRVQCQLTIISSKKVKPREAINLVYRALALEGFNAIESSQEIFIVPEGQEPKLSPELIDGSQKDIPEGRQRLIKVYPLKNVPPAELRDKVKPVLSDKAVVEVDDRASQLIVTDYNENLRLLGELIKALDVPSASDTVIEIYSLKHSEAEDMVTLLTLILNAQPPPPSSSGSSGGPSRSRPGGDGMPGGPGMMMISGPPPSSPSPSAAPAGGGTGAFKLWPDKTSNRIIVAAAKSKLPEVEKLIDILDVEKPEDVGVRVIPLKNVSAEDLVKDIGPLYQKASGKSLKEAIEVTASSRANSLIVLSSEANFKAIQKLVNTLDTEDAQEKVMQAFTLKNADAEDVARQLKELSQDQDSQRYPYYIFYGGMQSGKASKKPSVVADRRRNAVIVQAPPSAMESIAKTIQSLDEPIVDDGLAPKIFRLRYVSAADVEDVLNELFLKKSQQRSYYYFFDENPPETPERNVGRLYGKVRITSEPYSNTIIVTANSKENLAAIEDVLKQLDAPSEAGESTLRVGLKFAKAPVVANNINVLFAKNGSPFFRQQGQPGQPQPAPAQQQQQNGPTPQNTFELEKESKEEPYYPWLGGNPDSPRGSDGRTTARQVSDLVGRVRAVADLRSNGLLISANAHLFPQILKLVSDLDAPTEQVLIEARLVEISSDFLDKLGVRWSPDGNQVFTPDDLDNAFLAQMSGQHTTGFGGKTAVNNPPFSPPPGTVNNSSVVNAPSLAQTLTELRSGVLQSTINMDVLVQFLRKTSDAKVLAEPQINIRDNETGRLFVGQQVPIPLNSVVSQLGTPTTSFTYKDVGVVLEVTPHINATGDVELSIHAESSTVVPGEVILGGSVFDTRAFRTDLTAKNGETLVLGGIIQKQVTDTLRKTPLLGDIPGLGWAFKKKDKTSREVELMVFMRPRVTHNPEQNLQLLEDIYKKAPGMKQWNEELSPENHKPRK